MISEIIKFENIGTPNYLIKLSHLIKDGQYSKDNIGDFFTNEIIDGNTIFDGGVYLLHQIDFLTILDSEALIIPDKNQHFLKSDKLLTNKIVALFFDKWMADDSFSKIFNHSTVYYDIDFSIVIDNAAFKFKYTKLKQFLIDFKVIDVHLLKDNCFSVDSKYKKFFDGHIIPEVKKRMLSLKELKGLQNRKNRHGEGAEVFILKIEKQKFKTHILVNAIEQISHIDATAGYDISSLKSQNSSIIDKFIEVKSYSGKPYFYWSRNEMKVAKQEKDNYFLYLVNRDEMGSNNYQPTIIQNPCKYILNNSDWKRGCQNWKFENVALSIK